MGIVFIDKGLETVSLALFDGSFFYETFLYAEVRVVGLVEVFLTVKFLS